MLTNLSASLIKTAKEKKDDEMAAVALENMKKKRKADM